MRARALNLPLFCLLLALLCGLPLAGQAQAPDACGETESFNDCLDRVKNAAIDKARRAELVAIETEINAEVQKHLTSQTVPGTATSLRDALADVLTSFGLGTVHEGDGAVTLTLSPELLRFGPKNKLTVDLALRQPELYAPLVAALPEEGRADLENTLDKELGDVDDAEISLSWSRESERFGRVFRVHRHLIGQIFVSALEQAGGSEATIAFVNYLVSVNQGKPENQQVELNDSKAQAAAKGITLPADFESRLIAFGKAAGESVNQVGAKLDRSGFFRLADLVNNQPQIFVSASYRARDELAGPDIFSGTVTYEQGWANLNALRRWAEDRNDPSLSTEDLAAFLREGGLIDAQGQPTKALENAPRLSVSLSYNEASSLDRTLASGDVFSQAGSQSWKGSLGAGFYLAVDSQGIPQARFELQANYEDSDNPMQPETRVTATGTFTQRLADGSSAYLGLAWANKPEFLGVVNDEVSAHVGLKYGLEWGKPGQ